MTRIEKLIFILLSIITIGIYPAIVNGNSKKPKTISGELSKAKKIITNPENLLKALGGNDNILGVEYTYTKIKIIFKNKEKLNIQKIESLKGISGIFVTSKHLTIIVGNQAKDLSKML